MTVLDKLASALARRDEEPNILLAKQIAAKSDKNAIKELVDNLQNKKTAIQNDCIKVLYEIGEIKPALIAPYANQFVSLLKSKNNRLQWGAMTALNTITSEVPKVIFASIDKIAEAADAGSVITRDHAVSILAKLSAIKQYGDDTIGLLIAQLQTAPVNQLPLYAEKALETISDKYKKMLLETLLMRLDDVDVESKRKRIEKVIKKLK